jgi:hypothetical protein
MSRTLDELLLQKADMPEPRIVCLIGSTRYTDTSRQAILSEMLDGKIVEATYSDEMVLQSREDRLRLGLLHLQTIDHADEVLVLNKDGHIGETTLQEIEYAVRQGKELRWLEPPSDELLQLVSDSSRWTPAHPVFCIGIPDETFQNDLARAQEEAVFAPFGRVIRVQPMAYGEVAELARRHARPGETACLLFDLEHPHMVDLSVDLALYAYEVSGKKPICIYIGKDVSGKRAATVKYPSPR